MNITVIIQKMEDEIITENYYGYIFLSTSNVFLSKKNAAKQHNTSTEDISLFTVSHLRLYKIVDVLAGCGVN